MKKIFLILIIAILLLVVVAIFFFAGGSKPTVQPENSETNQNVQSNANKKFEIQGMKVEILKEGSGVAARVGDTVTIHYIGKIEDGRIFYSTVESNRPYTFLLEPKQVMQGLVLGIEGMKVGEKRNLTIPPELAYGQISFDIVPPNATLTFEVELLKIGE